MAVTRASDQVMSTSLDPTAQPTELSRAFTAGLTDEQARAVVTPAQTVCVLAAAGAGKTRVLTRRIAYRLAAGTATPEHVLAITFTRKAAGELKERLATAGGGGVATATFHSLALAQLRRYWSDRRAPAPALIESKLRLLAEIVADRPALREVPALELASHIEWAKARALSPEEIGPSASANRRQLPCEPEELGALYRRYEHEKMRRRLVDFDDLLARYTDALRSDGRFAAAQRWRWRHVFVDELQDVNPLQCRLLEALIGDNDDLFVVGDPNQAIYGWNGADPEFLVEFPRRWPRAEVVRLSANHRSTPEIVAAAGSVLGSRYAIPHSTKANGAKPELRSYGSDDEEALSVALAVRKANEAGLAFSDMAVLTRTNAQHAPILGAMARLGLPVRCAGSEVVVDDAAADSHALQDGRDFVTVSSFHRAKGLQWKAVWVAGLEQGLVPIAYATTVESVTEERRLLYVALTRAEEQLHCSWSATRRSASGAWLRREPSMWLEDIAKHCTVPTAAAHIAGSSARPTSNACADPTKEGANMIDLVSAARRRLARARSPLAHPPTDDPVGDAVASSLREWRRRMARASGVPAHVILHDSTVELLARQRPLTTTELLALAGMGPVKVNRFGPAVCEVIRESLAGTALQEGA